MDGLSINEYEDRIANPCDFHKCEDRIANPDDFHACEDSMIANPDNFHHEKSLNLTYEEDEIFFGAVSEKEMKKALKLQNRKTEYFPMSPLVNCTYKKIIVPTIKIDTHKNDENPLEVTDKNDENPLEVTHKNYENPLEVTHKNDENPLEVTHKNDENPLEVTHKNDENPLEVTHMNDENPLEVMHKNYENPLEVIDKNDENPLEVTHKNDEKNPLEVMHKNYEIPLEVTDKNDENPLEVTHKNDENPLEVTHKNDENPLEVIHKNDENPLEVTHKNDGVSREEDFSVLSSSKKISVASTVSQFVPNFDSTRTSVDSCLNDKLAMAKIENPLEVMHKNDENPLEVTHKNDENPLEVTHKNDENPLEVTHKNDENPLEVIHKNDEIPLEVIHKNDEIPLEVTHENYEIPLEVAHKNYDIPLEVIHKNDENPLEVMHKNDENPLEVKDLKHSNITEIEKKFPNLNIERLSEDILNSSEKCCPPVNVDLLEKFEKTNDDIEDSLSQNHSETNFESGINSDFSSELNHDISQSDFESYEKIGENYVECNEINNDQSLVNISGTYPDKSFNSCSEKLNDTLEEMELLLKHIENFEKDKSISQEDGVSREEDFKDFSVLSSSKKISVASTVSQFVPNFDSTRTSVDSCLNDKLAMAKIENINETQPKMDNISPTVTTPKKEAPPKPPRNIQAPLSNNKNTANNLLKVPNKDYIKTPITPKETCKKINNFATPKSLPTYSTKSPNSFKENRIEFKKETKCITPLNKNERKCITSINKNDRKCITPINKNDLKCITPINKLPHQVYLSKTGDTRNKVTAKLHKPFYSPQPRINSLTKQQQKNTISKHKKVGGLNIISPVAKYLQENPPPPLIRTVKPRFKISPMRIHNIINNVSENGIKTDAINCLSHIDSSSMKTNETPVRILSEINKLKESKYMNDGVLTPRSSIKIPASILPTSVYHPAKALHLENKENTCNMKGIPMDRPPSSIVKHKGRVQLPKSSVLQSLKNEHNVKDNSTPDLNFSSVSLVDVSLYEATSVNRTNTLH